MMTVISKTRMMKDLKSTMKISIMTMMMMMMMMSNDDDELDDKLDDNDDDDDEEEEEEEEELDDDELEYCSEEVMRWKLSQRHHRNLKKKDRLDEDLSSMMNLEMFTRESEKDKDGDAFTKDSIRRVCGLDGCHDHGRSYRVLGSSSEGVDVYANRDFEKAYKVVEVCARLGVSYHHNTTHR